MKTMTKKELEKFEAVIFKFVNSNIANKDKQEIAIAVWNRWGYIANVTINGKLCIWRGLGKNAKLILEI